MPCGRMDGLTPIHTWSTHLHLPALFSELETELPTAFAGTLTAGQQHAPSAWVTEAVGAGSAGQTLVTTALMEGQTVGC